MRLFLLSLLAIGCAKAYTIGNPYRSAYWTYSPARGEFPVQTSVSQGYLRYFDNSGNERLVTYNYPEPVYAVRQLSYVSDGQSSGTPVFRTFTQDDSIEFTKAREAHFRAWALQQYQALKCEMDALRAEGKEPSADMYVKFQPLEKIALTADYSQIADIPAVKQIREEHLRIWNEAHDKNLQTVAGRSTVNDNQGEFKTYQWQPSSTLVTVEGTPEQKHAHDEHLRIHNEQIAHLKHLEAQNKQLEAQNKQQFAQRSAEQLSKEEEGYAEFARILELNLLLWNQAKLSLERAGLNIHDSKEAMLKEYERLAHEQLDGVTRDQIPQRLEQLNKQYAEMQKAHEEHLRLLNAGAEQIHEAEEHLKNIKQEKSSTDIIGQNQQVHDTPEVTQAREKHLRILHEATLRAEIAQQVELNHILQSLKHVAEESRNLPTKIEAITKENEAAVKQPSSDLKYIPNIDQQTHTHQIDFQKAQDDHLRLVNEATAKIKAAEEQIKQLAAQQQQAAQQEQQQVTDTPEVIQARNEHLQLVNEAKLRAQSVEQEEQKYKQENVQESHQVPLLKSHVQQHDGYHYEKPQAVHETPIKAQIHQEQQRGFQQTSETQHNVEETPEVKHAREEHLRIFNTVKARNEQEEAKIAEIKSSSIISKPLTNDEVLEKIKEEERLKEENRLIELEALREAERLQEEYRQTELERQRETERLNAEQEKLKAELRILKIEDDKQFTLDKLLEDKRLKEQQDELQKLQQIDGEESKQTEFPDAVPLIQAEARFLQLEDLREAERLQEQYRQLELERLREAERLAQEEQQMKSEQIYLKIEDENQFQKDKLKEESRLQLEQEQLQRQQQLDNKQTQPITKTFEQTHQHQHQQQHQHQYKYANNPYLRAYPIQSYAQPITYSNNPFLKSSSSFKTPIVYYPYAITPNNVPVQSTNIPIIPVARYIQTSSHPNTGSKVQHTKDDFIKTKYSNTASTQPADTAVALSALQRATNDHFRAHERALEQLRLARIQNPNCN